LDHGCRDQIKGGSAKPEQFIDNSILTDLEKAGFANQLYAR
jgi:hypothetical protein